MKLIWLSVAPYAPTGYGLVTRQIVSRIQKEGHEVVVATKHFHTGKVVWEGIPTIPGTDINILNRMIDNGEVDYIISLVDNHGLPGIPKKWVSYTPFDTEHIPESIAKWLVYPLMIIALTRHGQKEIESLGYECLYAPHGVDTEIYCPNEAKRQEGRENLGWQDNFIIGSVGINYSDDRKNFINLAMAFKKFHDKHEEARLFLSTTPTDTDGNFSLPLAIKDLGLDQLVKYPFPDSYFKGEAGDETMANRYRQLDLFCFPTRGEGFGLPMIEAQSCGVPVVATGASTCPELCATQYLIPVHDYEWEWFNKAWRPNVNAESICNALERAYNDRQRASVAELGRNAMLAEYDWDYVFKTYWKPILKKIEGLKTKVQTIPDYKKLYEKFDGRIAMGDCGKWCGGICGGNFPLLPGENKTDRPILARSYPVMPDKDGNLKVERACPLYNWLSKKFKNEVKETWEYIWGFPKLRDYFKSRILGDNFVPIDELKIEFNSEYQWAMQSRYYTNAPDIMKYMNGSALEVGCGDGARVKALTAKGIKAVGIEVNPSHVGNLVQKGTAEAIEYPENSFGTVYSVDVLEHLENPTIALAEMFRVSKELVINTITPADDATFWQDPTHKVEWDRERWKREVNEFGEIINILEPFTIVARKRRE